MIEKSYYVILCKNCGMPRVVRSWQKGFYCFKCKKYVKNGRVIKKSDRVREVIDLVKEIKKKGL